MTERIHLSLLDLAPVGRGTAQADAVTAVREVASWADGVGLNRFWVAEHHGSANIASSAPAVLLAAVGAATERIRIGSGGVMLPNHPPLVVAESFGTLAALYPDRVDLGIGRAPGTNPQTAQALRRSPDERFGQDLTELLSFVRGRFTGGHPYETIRAVPRPPVPPQTWLLGSSTTSARLAGELGLRYAFAHHFFGAPGAADALVAYREAFRPAEGGPSNPHAVVTAHVVCGENDEHARYLAAPALAPALGVGGPAESFADPGDVAMLNWNEQQRTKAELLLADQAVGGSETVAARLSALVTETGADELMVTNNVTDVEERLNSHKRVHALWNTRVHDTVR